MKGQRIRYVLHQAGGGTLDGASCSLDNAGNRTAKTDLLANATTNYGYNSIYELLSSTGGSTESYTYDSVGNRLSSLAGSFTYNSSNELLASPSAIYTYDANGNMLTKTDTNGTTQYAWNYENQLTSVTPPGSGGATTFLYDPFGRRIQKSSPQGTTNFAYDGANIVGEYDTAGALVAKYAQGAGIDEPLSMWRDRTMAYYSADGLGTVTSLEDAAGTVVAAYTYDSFGNLTSQEPQLINPFRYTGREWDQETNLYYYRARYYDPSIGRFISEDPIRLASGTTNFYAYVGNDPIDYVDPFGLSGDCGKPKCFAQLKYRPVDDWRAKMFGRTHAFWYVQGSTGIQYILTAGPTPPNGGNQTLNAWANTDIQGGVDNVSATVWWNSGLSPENCKGVDAMIAGAQGWPQNTIPYHPVEGPNSDTAAHSLGTTGGFTPSAPPGTMGWNTPLPH